MYSATGPLKESPKIDRLCERGLPSRHRTVRPPRVRHSMLGGV
jgi:hypothetical protein